MILEAVLPLELAIDQLPHHFTWEERHYELRYLSLLDGEAFTGTLVVVSDVSPRIERERSEAGQRELPAIFGRTLADRNAFGEFLEACGAPVDAIAVQGKDLVTLERHIHTLKGNTALDGVETVSRLCRELEAGARPLVARARGPQHGRPRAGDQPCGGYRTVERAGGASLDGEATANDGESPRGSPRGTRRGGRVGCRRVRRWRCSGRAGGHGVRPPTAPSPPACRPAGGRS